MSLDLDLAPAQELNLTLDDSATPASSLGLDFIAAKELSITFGDATGNSFTVDFMPFYKGDRGEKGDDGSLTAADRDFLSNALNTAEQLEEGLESATQRAARLEALASSMSSQLTAAEKRIMQALTDAGQLITDFTGTTTKPGSAPVYFGDSLPELPSPLYPAGAIYVCNGKVYVSRGDHWSSDLDAMDIQGRILDSQINETLLSRIALVDAPEDVAGSVAFQLAAEAAKRTAGLAAEAKARADSIAAEADVRAQSITGEATVRAKAVADEASARAAAIASEAEKRAAAITAEANARADALADEAEKRGAAITTEQTRAQDAESSLADSISTLTASVSGLSAGLQSEQKARADADSAEASSRNTLAARLDPTGDVGKAIATAQSTANSAVSANTATAGRVDTLSADLGTTKSNLQTEQTARADADGALSSRIDTLNATVSGHTASITSEAKARADADSALSTRVDTVSATAAANTAAISSETSARAGADSALSTRIDTVAATTGSNTSAITAETKARSDADSALSTRVDTVVASANTNAAAISSESTARANADSALSSRIDTVSASAGSNASAISAEASARASADSALSTRVDAVVATSSSNTAAISAEQTARTSADSALSSRVDTVSAAASASFDAALMWNFDTDGNSLGWYDESGGTLVVSGGALRTTAINTDSRIACHDFSAFNGGTYPIVRMRVRRTRMGNPYGWDGWLLYETASHGEDGNFGMRIPLPEGLKVLNTWTVLEFDMSKQTQGGTDWVSNQIKHLRIDLGTDANDIFEFDWIAVGRMAPGASLASLQSEQSARATADSALSTRIDSLTTTVSGNTASITAEQNARAAADSANASAISTVQASLSGGGNLLPNAAFEVDASGWRNSWRQYGSDALPTLIRDGTLPEWMPPGGHVLVVNRTGAQVGVQDVESDIISVSPGQLVCWSAYIAMHRGQMDLFLHWVDGNNNSITELHSACVANAGSTDRYAAGYKRVWVFATAPSGASKFVPKLRIYGTDAYSPTNNAICMVFRPMLEFAVAGQTQPSPWTPSAAGIRSDVNAAIVSEQTARTAADSALSSRVDTLTATVSGNSAAITAEQSARANADSTNAQSIQTVSSNFSTLSNNLGPVKNWVLGSWGNGSNGWAGIRSPLGAVQYSVGRSWGIITFGADGSPSVATHDVFANGAATNAGTFAAALNALPYGTHVAVVTCDEPASYRSPDMYAALKRCGATQATLDALPYRGAYILVGFAGCGEGGGIEQLATTGETANSWLQYPIQVCGSKIVGSGGNLGAVKASQAYVQNYAYSKTAADSAIATSVSNVSARLNDGGDIKSALVRVQSTANTTAAAVSGTWGVTVDANGRVTGMKYYSDGKTAEFKIAADKVLIGDYGNFCSNGCGASTDGWTGATVVDFDWSGYISGNAGKRALRFRTRDTEYGNWFDVKPGDKFFCSFDSVPGGGGTNPHPVSVGLHLQDGAGASNIWVGAAQRPTSAFGGYSAKGMLEIPAGFSRARIWVQIDGASGTDYPESAGVCYATNIVVRRMNGAELIVDGAITANKLSVSELGAITTTTGDMYVNKWLRIKGGGDGDWGGIRTMGKNWSGDGVDGFVCYRNISDGTTRFEAKSGSNWLRIQPGGSTINFSNNFTVDNAGNVTANNIKARGDIEATTLKADTIMVGTGHLAAESGAAARSALKAADQSCSVGGWVHVLQVAPPYKGLTASTFIVTISGTTGSDCIAPDFRLTDGAATMWQPQPAIVVGTNFTISFTGTVTGGALANFCVDAIKVTGQAYTIKSGSSIVAINTR